MRSNDCRIIQCQSVCRRIKLCLSAITKDIVLVRTCNLGVTYPNRIS